MWEVCLSFSEIVPKLRPFLKERFRSLAMDAQSYKTTVLKGGEITREWLVVDAANLPLGRLASRVAFLIRGKHKAAYTPFLNCGANVVVLNAERVFLSGRKLDQRQHLHHTGYPGGQRSRTPRQILAKRPAELIELSVRGMLPKNKLGNDLFRNLYVYAGTAHPHAAQAPTPYQLPL
jgi:large subunit ribosomal protein L13